MPLVPMVSGGTLLEPPLALMEFPTVCPQLQLLLALCVMQVIITILILLMLFLANKDLLHAYVPLL